VHWRVQREAFAAIGSEAELRRRSAVVGSTMLDQLALVDRAAVRRKYGLAPDRPVVLLMSLKMAVPEPHRRLTWAGGWRGWRAAKALATGHGAPRSGHSPGEWLPGARGGAARILAAGGRELRW
jgi:hypothetical protein